MFLSVKNSLIFSNNIKMSNLYRIYLRDVNIGSFGPGDHHHFEVVEFGQRFLGRVASFVTGVIQNSVHLILKGLPEIIRKWSGRNNTKKYKNCSKWNANCSKKNKLCHEQRSKFCSLDSQRFAWNHKRILMKKIFPNVLNVAIITISTKSTKGQVFIYMSQLADPFSCWFETDIFAESSEEGATSVH